MEIDGVKIEYKETDKEDYMKMVAKVRAIDADAADYLENVAPNNVLFAYDGDLILCFPWNETPQGREFWCEMREKIA